MPQDIIIAPATTHIRQSCNERRDFGYDNEMLLCFNHTLFFYHIQMSSEIYPIFEYKTHGLAITLAHKATKQNKVKQSKA
uniref:Uncharacterized protein n=1 Tax=Glossina palpalis gambiensis TaxID=67801 RepID=A0A1B0B065_9MUSC